MNNTGSSPETTLQNPLLGSLIPYEPCPRHLLSTGKVGVLYPSLATSSIHLPTFLDLSTLPLSINSLNDPPSRGFPASSGTLFLHPGSTVPSEVEGKAHSILQESPNRFLA